MEARNHVEEDSGERGRGVGVPMGMKCATLENLSTTMRITDLPLMRGNPSTKSVATLAQMVDGTLIG
jgi:hypothetical protein